MSSKNKNKNKIKNREQVGMWGNAVNAESKGLLPGRRTLGPIFLLTVCPFFVLIIHYNLTKQNGSLVNLFNLFKSEGILNAFHIIFPKWDDIINQWKLLGAFSLMELIFMRILPGKPFEGPVAPSGHIPIYKANGVPAFIISIVIYFLSGFFGYTYGTVYKQFGAILAFLNLFALSFCVILVFKGYYFPSTKDSGTTGNLVVDYFWGTELYPRIFGFDVKTFTNCRFGLMGWALLVIDFTLYQYYENNYQFIDSTLVSCLLQLIYIFKFFWWETGYWRSIDIMHDRAGWCLCWGCMVWVPSVYTSQTLFLATTPLNLGFPLALSIFLFGVLMIWINYDSDQQRYEFRQSQGKKLIWGKKPLYIEAKYKTDEGKYKTNLLLISGYWRISRHFHYIPEWLAALSWTIPLHSTIMPYFYVIFLFLLLTDRSVRDDHRCGDKYGNSWKEYCEKVPYRIIPYIF